MPHPLFFVAGAVIVLGAGYLIINELKNQSNEGEWYRNYCETVTAEDQELLLKRKKNSSRKKNTGVSGEEDEEEADEDEDESKHYFKQLEGSHDGLRKRNAPSGGAIKNHDFPLIDLRNQSYPPSFPRSYPPIITTTNLRTRDPSIPNSINELQCASSKVKPEEEIKQLNTINSLSTLDLNKENEKEQQCEDRLQKTRNLYSGVKEKIDEGVRNGLNAQSKDKSFFSSETTHSLTSINQMSPILTGPFNVQSVQSEVDPGRLEKSSGVVYDYNSQEIQNLGDESCRISKKTNTESNAGDQLIDTSDKEENECAGSLQSCSSNSSPVVLSNNSDGSNDFEFIDENWSELESCLSRK
ncbi:hypothetical protein BY996DRAFT_6428448 [Phakopsora pachyrhizi]|uniref:Expressed protein n=1 Tax=Phakopsora pachyrhizi TaxID=170000 RepID=A0AAV0BWG1_PHAPC|nr:hypothetical protein BY996DRAFT_6428448 [Phakopsora pachyrhizi]CAH7675938.1 expressed protein [Phakopsora pachyrhizi]CAH7690456.1 expressed protein [Phakopsora pachyrhizi]